MQNRAVGGHGLVYFCCLAEILEESASQITATTQVRVDERRHLAVQCWNH